MPERKHIEAHKLRDYRLEGWREKISGQWSYRQLASDPEWCHGWISFDAVTWNPNDHLVYCGLNSMDGDLLYSFDPVRSKFECLNAKSWADVWDVKIHRTILVNPNDHCLYFATSLLHDPDQQQRAPGGKVVRYDPVSRKYTVLSTPVRHLYIQSIAADWKRNLIYGFTYPAEFLFILDLGNGVVSTLAYIGNAIMFAQPHNAVVDNEGWLWGTFAETRAWDEHVGPVPIRLFKYHPKGGRFVWFEHGLSRRTDTQQLIPPSRDTSSEDYETVETRHTQDFGFCDSMVYDSHGFIYAGTTAGVLSRIDVGTGEVVKVCDVIPIGRFPALAIRDGILYGGGGVRGKTQLLRLDLKTGCLSNFRDLTDPKIDDRPSRIHEIAISPDHTLYLGENDNHFRSSYLWSVHLD